MGNKYVDRLKKSIYNTPTNYNEFEDYYTDNLQEKINETYEMASDTMQIEEEKVSGTLEFSPLVCRVNHAIEPKTGLNLGDDFKELKFFNLSYPRIMGQRYKFSNSIWLTVNTDNYRYVTKSAIVRRYNNELRWIDTTTGKLISEPCIVDYAIKYANLYFNNTVNIPQGTLVIITQYNENTKQIRINDRFILGSHAYKVKTVLDSLRSETYEQDSVPLITFQVYVDTTFADDNFTIGSGQYNPDYPENLANVLKYKNLFYSNEIGDDNIVITPTKQSLFLNESVDFSCYAVVNDKQLDTTFTFEFLDLPSTYFTTKVIDGNHFSIKNIKPNLKKKLRVVCKSDTGNCQKELLLEMGGMF